MTPAETFKFVDLTTSARAVACRKYIEGWLETHPDEKFSMDEAYDLCFSDEDTRYDSRGEVVDGTTS